MKLIIRKRKREEHDVGDHADDHASALKAAAEDANDDVQDLSDDVQDPSDDVQDLSEDVQDLSEEVQDAIEDAEDLVYARLALRDVEEEIVEDGQGARKNVVKKSTLTAEQVRLTSKSYKRRRVGVLRTASGGERATGAPFNVEPDPREETEEGQPYLPSAHPSVSVSAPVTKKDFDALLLRVEALESKGKKRPYNAAKSDWKVECTHANHCLELIYKKQRGVVEECWKWQETHAVTPTPEGCMPTYTYSPQVKVSIARGFTLYCKKCNANTVVRISVERQLLWLNTPDEELYKLVEYDENAPSGAAVKYHASHICKVPGGVLCLNRKHVFLETASYNNSQRKKHQNGSYCDCHLHGHEKCIGPGQKYIEEKPLEAQEKVDVSKSTETVPYRGKKCQRCLKRSFDCNNEQPCNHCTEDGQECIYKATQSKKRFDRKANNDKQNKSKRLQQQTERRKRKKAERQQADDEESEEELIEQEAASKEGLRRSGRTAGGVVEFDGI